MRVIASFVGGWGHVEPLLPLVTLAASNGHDVSFAGQMAVVRRLAERGHRVDVVGPDTLRTSPSPLIPVDREAERAVMRDHFVADYGRTRAAELSMLFARESADLVICDEVDVGAVVAAEAHGIACVTVNVIAAGNLTSPSVVGSAWSKLRVAYGLEPDPTCARLGGTLSIGPLPRSFRAPDLPPPGTMRFVQPPIVADIARLAGTPDRIGRPGSTPRAYFTLGTVFNLESGDLPGRLIEAANTLAADGFEVIITTGPGGATSGLPTPRAGVRVREFVPLREALGGCDVVVCHGGSGTVIAALSLGIPVVVLPMGADQPDNADRCNELDVGIVLDPVTATPDAIAAATRAVTQERAYRSSAATLGREARAQPRLNELPSLRHLLAG